MKLTRFIAFAPLMAALALPRTAYADKVALLPPVPVQASDEGWSQPIQAILEAVVTRIGHSNASPSEMLTAEVVSRGRSQDLREVLQQVARVASSDWAVSTRVEGRKTGYKLEVEACQAATGRVESLAREVESAQADSQIEEMLRLLLRPEGIANADISWEHALPTAPPPPLTPSAPDAGRAALPAPEKPTETLPLLAPAPPQPPKETPLAAAPPPPPAPAVIHPYAEKTSYAASAGIGFLTAASRPNAARGTATSGIFDLGFGYTPATIPGLEVGGRIGWSLGGPASFALNGTARYMFPVVPSPRIYVGPELGLGMFAALGAKQEAYLDLHAAAIGAWNILPNFGCEAVFSLDGAVGSLFLVGGAARAVVRF